MSGRDYFEFHSQQLTDAAPVPPGRAAKLTVRCPHSDFLCLGFFRPVKPRLVDRLSGMAPALRGIPVSRGMSECAGLITLHSPSIVLDFLLVITTALRSWSRTPDRQNLPPRTWGSTGLSFSFSLFFPLYAYTRRPHSWHFQNACLSERRTVLTCFVVSRQPEQYASRLCPIVL